MLINTNERNIARSYVSWNGGTEPRPLNEVSELEKTLVSSMFEMQCAAFRAFWDREPDSSTRLLFHNRARYDAHATVRDGRNTRDITG